jgi:tetratricopeptide (TPR) repeat protein
MVKGPEPSDGIDAFRIAIYFVPPCCILLTAAWFSLLARGSISGLTFVVLLLLNLPIALAGVWLINLSLRHTAVTLGRALLAAGDIPPPPSYPNQDLLIGQGHYAEAADYFRDHIRITPSDVAARLRLADLLERQLGDLGGAEAEYLEVRRLASDPRAEFAATTGLIDLYRKLGQRDRLAVELARCADRYRGTPPGAAAAQELWELKTRGSG